MISRLFGLGVQLFEQAKRMFKQKSMVVRFQDGEGHDQSRVVPVMDMSPSMVSQSAVYVRMFSPDPIFGYHQKQKDDQSWHLLGNLKYWFNT